MTALSRVDLVLLVSLVLHDADHLLNQPSRHIAAQVVAIGLIGLASGVAVAILALGRHPLAAPASVLVGFGNAAGFVAVHLLPKWSVLSDPYSHLDLNVLSWFGVVVPITVALLAGVAGLRGLRPADRAAA